MGHQRPGRLRVPPAFRRDGRVPRHVELRWLKIAAGELIQLRDLTVCGPLRALDAIPLSDSGAIHLTQIEEDIKATFRRSRPSSCAAVAATAARRLGRTEQRVGCRMQSK